MFRICCSTFHVGAPCFGVKPPYEDRRETHGICPDCLPRELAKLNDQVAQIRTRANAAQGDAKAALDQLDALARRSSP
jgi:hypothetical protein